MAVKLEMPKLSDTMQEGTLVRWLVALGDEINIGDEVAEIETDKATMAMESFDEGVLTDILVNEGEKVPIGAVLGILDGDGNGGTTPSDDVQSTPAATEQADAAPSTSSQAKGTQTQGRSVEQPDGSRIKASPLARKVAADKGVELASLTGTGPGGRILKKDVENADAGKPAAPPVKAPTAAPAASPAPAPRAIVPNSGTDDTRVELSTMRRVIAERLLTSKVTIPHFYLHVEVDAAPLMELRKQINAQAEATHGNKYSVNDFVLKAAINALQACPAVNASFAGDHIVQFGHIGIAVAVAVPDGLVTPVIKDADKKSLLQISREVKDLAKRARENKLKPSEFDGGTLTISNLGTWGIENFDAIINPPQAAILSVGAIVEKPVVKDGKVVPGMRMNIGVSGDHRVVDGAVGAEFISQVKKLIENPALMLV